VNAQPLTSRIAPEGIAKLYDDMTDVKGILL
jgi:hypothetical protein